MVFSHALFNLSSLFFGIMQIIFSVASGLDNPAYAKRELRHGIAWGEGRSWRMGHCGALTGDSRGMDTRLTGDAMLIPSHSPVDTVLSGMGYQSMGYALDWTMGAWGMAQGEHVARYSTA